MTLIQTVLTRDFILQVSDRRLTKGRPNSTSVLIDDEKYTKLICWNNTFTVGFTGIARIDRSQSEATSHWIAKVLSDYPLFEAGVIALQASASKKIKELKKNWDRRLAIVISGFDHRNVPLIAIITNFDLSTGIPLPDPTNFQSKMSSLDRGHHVGTHVAGQPLTVFQARLLSYHVRKMVRKPCRINQAVRVMVDIQRHVAKNSPTVGADALCVLIPRKREKFAGPAGVILTNLGGPELSIYTSSFGFFDKKGWQYEQTGPITADNGFVQEVWGSADPDNPDNQTIGTRFLKVPASWMPNAQQH